MANAGTITFTLNADNSQMMQALRGARQQTDQFAGSIQRLSFGKFVNGKAVLLALGAAAVKSVKVFAEFEASLDRVGAITGQAAGGAGLEAMKNTALELAKTSQYTATEVTKAYNFMAMAGMDANTIMASTPAVLQLASAGAIELGDAADIVTNVMAGFGKSSDELAQVNDVMVAAITGANVDIRQMGEAFKYAGPVAKAAGVSFNDATTAIALMGNAGIQGSLAGTTLRGAISKLLNPSKEAAMLLESMGVKAQTSSGKMRPLFDILGDMQKAGLTAGEAMEIFGVRAGPGMLALLEQGMDSVDDFKERLEAADGTASEMSERTMKTLKGRFNAMMASVEALAVSLGQLLEPAASAVIEVVSVLSDWIKKLVDSLEIAFSGVKAFYASMLAFNDAPLEEWASSIQAKLAARAGGPEVAATFSKALSKGAADADMAPLRANLEEAVTFSLDAAIMEWKGPGFDFGDGIEGLDARVNAGMGPTGDEFLEGLQKLNGGVDSISKQWEADANRALMNAQLDQAIKDENYRRDEEYFNKIWARKEEEIAAHDKLKHTLIGAVAPAFGKLGGVVASLASGDMLGAMAAGIGAVISESKSFGELAEASNELLAAIVKVVDAFGPLIKAIGKLIHYIAEGIGRAADGVEKAFTWLKETVTGNKEAIEEETSARYRWTMARWAEMEKDERIKKALEEPEKKTLSPAELKAKDALLTGNLEGLTDAQIKFVKKMGPELLAKYEDMLARAEFGEGVDYYGTMKSMRVVIDNISGILEDTGVDLSEAVVDVSSSLEDGGKILEDTTKEMNKSLTSVPAGLKVALLRYNAINGSGIGAVPGSSSLPEQASQGGAGGVNILGDVHVNGVTNLDEIEEAINKRTREAMVAHYGAMAAQGKSTSAINKPARRRPTAGR